MQRALRPQKSVVSVVARRYGENLPQLPQDGYVCAAIILAGKSKLTGEVIKMARAYAGAVVTLATQEQELLAQLDPVNILEQIEDVIPVPLSMNPPLTPVSRAAGDEEGTEKASVGETDTDEPPLITAVLNELAGWLAEKLLEEDRLVVAQAYPYVRRAVALELSRKVAFENAMISAVFFLPGADMPLLTLNQMRLVIQIASLYELPLGTARLKEILVLVAGAFGCRALVRAVASRLSFMGLAARVGVSYAATLGIGMAALEFYDKFQGDFVAMGESLAREGKQLAASSKDLSLALKDTTVKAAASVKALPATFGSMVSKPSPE